MTISNLISRKEINVPSKKRKPTVDEILWIILDAGNSDVKWMIHGAFGEARVMPQMVRKVSEADYNNLKQSYKYKVAHFEGTAIFSVDGQGYVVGQHATEVGAGIRHTGTNKYRRDHMGAILEAALIQVYPESHPNVGVVILHPTGINSDNMKALIDSIKGTHKITVADGRSMTYKVKTIIPLEESVAALQTFMLNQDGRPYQNIGMDVEPGDTFLSVDVGGFISGISRGRMTKGGAFEVDLASSVSIQAGIQDVLRIFASELKAAFPDQLANVQTIPQEMMNRALQNGGQIIIKGKSYDCKRQIDNSMQAISGPIEREFTTRFQSGVSDNAIVISGGGGGIAGDYLKANVLKHDFVHAAEPKPENMRLGAIYGGSKGMYSFLVTYRG